MLNYQRVYHILYHIIYIQIYVCRLEGGRQKTDSTARLVTARAAREKKSPWPWPPGLTYSTHGFSMTIVIVFGEPMVIYIYILWYIIIIITPMCGQTYVSYYYYYYYYIYIYYYIFLYLIIYHHISLYIIYYYIIIYYFILLYVIIYYYILLVINCSKSLDYHPTGGVQKKIPQEFIDEKTIGVVRQPSPVWNRGCDAQDIPTLW